MKKIPKQTNSCTSAMPQRRQSRHSLKKRGNEVIVGRETTDREIEDVEVTKAWNLRPRKDGNVSGAAAVGNVAVPEGCTKLWISLSREEIEEDLLSMTGSKHIRRVHKKRPQSVQKQLDKLFPGSKFVGLTANTYRIPDPLMAGYPICENTKTSVPYTYQRRKKLGARGNNKKIALDRKAELFLPPEIMFEILSRLTIQSLVRFRCVCKQWNEMIQERNFIEMQMKQESKLSFYYNSEDGIEETFTFLDRRDGLLVEKSNITGIYRVRNPTTKQAVDLPDPLGELLFMNFCFIPSTNSYKLVYTYEESEGEIGDVGCKVLTLRDSDLSWRLLENSYLHELDPVRLTTSVIVIDSLLYFFGLCKDGSTNPQMHCLDVKTEIFTGSPISVPWSLFHNWENVWCVEWYGMLSLVSIIEEDLHIWVLEDFIKRKWAGKKIIIPLTFLKENPSMRERLTPSFVSWEQIWFYKDYGVQIIVYHVESKQISKSQSAPPGKIIFSVNRSLVTLKGMKPEKEQHENEAANSAVEAVWAY